MDAIFWAVSTLFTVGYGAPSPETTAGRWVCIVYIASAVFIGMNIIASISSLPTILHRRVITESPPLDTSPAATSRGLA